MNNNLEIMSEFFDKRVDSYEEHMFNNVSGAAQFYAETAKLIPLTKNIKLLDLGCGTGLELDQIFLLNPTVMVTGVDLSSKMLERLKAKHFDKLDRIKLINASYFDVDYGINTFDVAVSVQTMHHFTHEQKISLYKKIFDCLKPGSCYVETDYVALTQEEEDFFYSEKHRLENENKSSEKLYHFDTPCTVENQIEMLKEAGFNDVNIHYRHKSTCILISVKCED